MQATSKGSDQTARTYHIVGNLMSRLICLQVDMCPLLDILWLSVIVSMRSIRTEPGHEISNNLVCATSKASDQPAHMRSLIRAFASRLSIL